MLPPPKPISTILRETKMIQDEENKRKDPKNYPDPKTSNQKHGHKRRGGKVDRVK